MKKTLIALLALSGVASAAPLWNTSFAVDNTGGWTVANENESLLKSSDWTLTAADGSALSSTTKNSEELRPNTNVGSNQGWNLEFSLTNISTFATTISDMKFDTFIFAGSGAYQGLNTNRDFVFTLTVGNDTYTTGNWTIEGNTTASPGNGLVNFNFSDGLTLAAGEEVNVTFSVAKGESNAGCFLGLKGISAGSEPATAVPEPTTATLSLLALAALAARRRRK